LIPKFSEYSRTALQLVYSNDTRSTDCVERRDIDGWSERGGSSVIRASAMPARRWGFLMYVGLPMNTRMKLSRCSRSSAPLCCRVQTPSCSSRTQRERWLHQCWAMVLIKSIRAHLREAHQSVLITWLL